LPQEKQERRRERLISCGAKIHAVNAIARRSKADISTVCCSASGNYLVLRSRTASCESTQARPHTRTHSAAIH
jgi:hypothetical protein